MDIKKAEEDMRLVLRIQELEEENENLRRQLRQIGTQAMNAANSRTAVVKPEFHEIFSRPVSSLNLSVRASHCLEWTGIIALGQLVTWNDKSYVMNNKSLLKIRSFGRTSLREVKRKLADLGLRLGMTDEEIATWTPPQPK